MCGTIIPALYVSFCLVMLMSTFVPPDPRFLYMDCHKQKRNVSPILNPNGATVYQSILASCNHSTHGIITHAMETSFTNHTYDFALSISTYGLPNSTCSYIVNIIWIILVQVSLYKHNLKCNTVHVFGKPCSRSTLNQQCCFVLGCVRDVSGNTAMRLDSKSFFSEFLGSVTSG